MIKSYSDNIDKSTRMNLILLAGILLLALFLRLWNLGQYGFWTDELFHVIAARSYLENGSFFVPLTGEYTRAYPYTLCVALSFKLFGISEFSARLPSIFFSMVFLIIAYGILKRYFDRHVALLFTFFMAISPFVLIMTRECRMYTLFQTIYFLISFAFLRGFESSNPSIFKNFEVKWQINLSYLFLSGLLFLVALNIHKLSLNFGLIVLAYCTLMVLYVAYTEKLKNAIFSKYALIIASAGLATLLLFALNEDYLRRIIKMAIHVPPWDQVGHGNFGFYKKVIFGSQPVLFFIYPLSILLIMKDRFKLGSFIFLSFIILIFMHSFIFGRKNDRYIFYIFPFFVLGASFLTQKIITYLYNLTKSVNAPLRFRICYALAFLFLFNVFIYPQHGQILTSISKSNYPDWKIIPPSIKDQLKSGVVVTTRVREYYYYMGSPPDFWIRSLPSKSPTQNPDYTISVIDTATSLTSMLNKHKGHSPVYFVVDKWTFNNEAFVNSEMRTFLLSRMKPIPGFKDHQIMIFTV
jgi:4-amino-4-deoxy-L-arabinose transferase-like glycosyltransferase